MKVLAIAVAATLPFSVPVAAQLVPQPDPANPRIQNVEWREGQTIALTALPQTGLTVTLQPGEQIQRIVAGDERALDVRVSNEADSFLLIPQIQLSGARLVVETDRRRYDFMVKTERSLLSAYLVRIDHGQAFAAAVEHTLPASTQIFSYRVRGDRSVRPRAISDNGYQTTIAFADNQPLPAIFGIGATGDEEVVNGYMRGDSFVIDRFYEELVFRIDKEKATARRNDRPDARDG